MHVKITWFAVCIYIYIYNSLIVCLLTFSHLKAWCPMTISLFLEVDTFFVLYFLNLKVFSWLYLCHPVDLGRKVGPSAIPCKAAKY